MAFKAAFCYQTVTPESAEQGDSTETGWILPGMWKFALQDEDGYHTDVLDEAIAGEFKLNDLAEVIDFAESLGIHVLEDESFASVDPDMDYETGADTYYSLHIEGVSPSTYNRIVNLLRR